MGLICTVRVILKFFLLFPRKNFSAHRLQSYLLLICVKLMVVWWQISWFFIDTKE